MSTPRTTEGINIRVVPLAVFALVLLIPFLNFDFTLYRSTLKLFVYQTATTLLWGYLLWEWAAGRLARAGGPAYWLFVPPAAWAVWGAATAAWSPQGWLASGWVLYDFYGAAGALGLALLLRDPGHRRMFVAAGGAVAFALAFFMVLYYGDPRATFLGDIDHLSGRAAGAAFLLLPTLVAAAMLYRQTQESAEAGYRTVIWLAVLLAALLLAGVRTHSAAWGYAVGGGLAILAWLMLPRWRLAAVALALAVVWAAAQNEVQQAREAAEYTDSRSSARRAVLDAAEWRLVARSPLARQLAGNGVGTFRLRLDLEREVKTYAVGYGDEVIGHARRQLTEVLFERGLGGVAIAVAMGLACVAAGWQAFRRAREGFDSALGAGFAASVVAMGVFACFSNGLIGFGSGMMFWLGLGLLGALSVETGRPAAMSWSPEEEAGRGEAAPRLRKGRAAVAAGAIFLVAAAWCAVAARPFWAEYSLREGQSEAETCQSLFSQTRMAEQNLGRHRAAAKGVLDEVAKRLSAAEKALQTATAACDDAAKAGLADEKLKPLAAEKQAAKAALDKLRDAATQARAELDAGTARGEETLRGASAEYDESARRTDGYLRRAARLSLGDRVWLDAQIRRALLDEACDRTEAAVERFARLEALCGPAFDFDVQLADCDVRLGQLAKAAGDEALCRKRFAEANQLYGRYARKNPFGASCALFKVRVPFYEDWSRLISQVRALKAPEAATWGKEFVDAASEGLRWLPTHYGLLLLRGDMRYWLGQKELARQDVEEASALIETAIAQTGYPSVRASLYFELANANFRWDKEKALKWAKQVFLERIDPRDPQIQQVLLMARQIIRRLEPPKKEEPKPPDAKSPAPPKTKGDAEQPAPEAPKNSARPATDKPGTGSRPR